MEGQAAAGPSSAGFAAETKGRAGFASLAPSGPQGGLPARFWPALADTAEAWGRDPNLYCAVVDGAFGAALDMPQARSGLASAYQGIWRLDRFGKPFIALIGEDAAWNTIAGLITGTHKVADPAAGFAVRDVAEGRVPGWGASFHLAALPGSLGLYLAMTGARMDSALAYRLGWLTHRIGKAAFAAIKDRLADADPVDPVLDEQDEGAGRSPLDPFLPGIATCFSADGPAAILARLETATGADLAWAGPAAEAIRRADPEVLATTYRLLTRHAQVDLRCGLTMDFRVAVNGPLVSRGSAAQDAPFAPLADGEPDFADPPPPSIV